MATYANIALAGAFVAQGCGSAYSQSVFVQPIDDRTYTSTDWNDDHYADGVRWQGEVYFIEELLRNTKSNSKSFYFIALEYWDDLADFDPCQRKAFALGYALFFNTCNFAGDDYPASAIFTKTIEEFADDWWGFLTNHAVSSDWPIIPDIDVDLLRAKTTVHELMHQLSLNHEEVIAPRYCHEDLDTEYLSVQCPCVLNQTVAGLALLCDALVDDSSQGGDIAREAILTNLATTSSACICELHRQKLATSCSFTMLQQGVQ